MAEASDTVSPLFKRMTTSDYKMARITNTAKQNLEYIRRESMINLKHASIEKRKSINRRVMKNHEITEARCLLADGIAMKEAK